MVDYVYGWEPFGTWKILDAVDPTEYTALAEAKKDILRIVISAGTVNFRDGSPVWNKIMVTLFPEGTVTHAALREASKIVYVPTVP